MPTYRCKCSDCDAIFDVSATIKEKEEEKPEKFFCPKCKSKNVKHKFSLANFAKNVFGGNEKSEGCCSGPKEAAKDTCCCGKNDK